MNSHDDLAGEKSTFLESAIAGGLSGASTRLVLQPLDVVKTRFQLQVEPISKKYEQSKYKGVFQAVRLICKEETIFALWKGHVSAQVLSIIFGISQFTAYQQMNNYIHNDTNRPHSSFHSFYTGALATSIATLTSFPFDTIRTRFIAQGEIKKYRSTAEAVRKIVLNEGFNALFKGLSPTLVQSIPYGACQFGFYALFNEINTRLDTLSGLSIGNKTVGSLSAGFLAGTCAKTIVYPFDVMRKRLQIQGFNDVRKNFGKPFVCSGMIDCCVKIYQTESFSGFFKGLQPAVVKSAFTTSIYFTLYNIIFTFLKTL